MTDLKDGTERLCQAVYGRSAIPRDYIGGSEAQMLHDAADLIEQLQRTEQNLRDLLAEERQQHSAALDVIAATSARAERAEQALKELRAAVADMPIPNPGVLHELDDNTFSGKRPVPITPTIGQLRRIHRAMTTKEQGS